MGIFKGKTGIEGKVESVFHGGKIIATIVGTLETGDAHVIEVLTGLGYERVDKESAPPVPPEVPVVPSKKKGKAK